MYHCHVRFYLAGECHEIFEKIKKMPPLEAFTHEFYESKTLEPDNISSADVIIAHIGSNCDTAEIFGLLKKHRKENSELIVIAESSKLPEIPEYMQDINELWNAPMSPAETKFRFLGWQKKYKMSKDLYQSEHFLDAVINSSPSLIWFKDKNGVHEKVNLSFCNTVGKTREQVQGRTHAYIWNVEHDDPACTESDNATMRAGKTCISEETIQTGSGQRLLKTYKSPLYNYDGSVMGTVGVGIDYTREREFELEVKSKNNILETIFTTMDCGMICHTTDGKNIIRINNAALKILGYETQEELINDGFDMVAPTVIREDAEKLCAALAKLKNEGDSNTAEYRVLHKNGELIHVIGSAKIIVENGQYLYQRFLMDCTDQKLQEQYEREMNERYHIELIHALSVDYTVICFFSLNTGKGSPIRINSDSNLFDNIFMGDLDLETCMEKYISQFVHKDDKENMRYAMSLERLRREMSENAVSHTNYRIFRNNSTHYFQAKMVRVGSPDIDLGIVIGLHSVDEEIRREMEKKTILEKALRQANKANEAKSTFLFNMSHDIRTPMNAILGFTSLALSHIENTEQVEEYLKKIMSSGNLLLGLINDILDMSRIENGKMNFTESLCSLPGIFNELKSIFAEDIRKKHLVMNIDAENIVNEEIYCDKLRLNQVLMNLISNAIKYTNDSGLINITIREKNNAPDGYAGFEFNIKDTGIGMSKEFLSHIFEPFERERNSTISGIQGTGLGMAITKKIVDMMNGTIDVKSEYSIGTEVNVSFIFRVGTRTDISYVMPEFNGLRVLILCSDESMCRSTARMLSQTGMKTQWVQSADSAAEAAKKAAAAGNAFDVYFIDYVLSGINGIDAVKTIKNEAGCGDALFIMTGYDLSDIEEEAKAAGVSGFCSRPLFRSSLEECMKEASNRSSKTEEKNNEPDMQFTGRLLLVDDNSLNLEIASEILKEVGFDVETAVNGQNALDMVKSSQPGYYALVLMDVQMPVMNGYEATKEIRLLENRELAAIPILAMTANAFEEDKQEAFKSGMNGHISKPIDIEQLFGILEKVLKKH